MSHPPASGLNGVKPSPSSAHSGSTSRSASRSSSEYEFCTHCVARAGRRGERLAELRAVDVARADRADLALLHELVERAERLRDRHVGVPVVRQVHLHAVDTEALQAALELALHPLRREAVVLAFVHRD